MAGHGEMGDHMTGPSSPRWIALCREAAIAGQSISAGLTALRKANYAATGLYSHSFFSLSIGLERLFKLIYMIDFSVNSGGTFPQESDLRNNFGHNLDKLFAYAVSVHERMPNRDMRYKFPPGQIEDKIVAFLSKFARATRYYNVAYLTGGGIANTSEDPIAEWFCAIGDDIFAKHYSDAQRRRDTNSANIINTMIGEMSSVRYTAEDGTAMTDVRSASLQTGKNKILQKYGTFYCAKIARFAYMVLYDLNHEAHSAGMDVPYLYEFFFPFMNEDAYLLSRKTFPPRE